MKRVRRHQSTCGLPDEPVPCHYVTTAEVDQLTRQVRAFFSQRGEQLPRRWQRLHFVRQQAPNPIYPTP